MSNELKTGLRYIVTRGSDDGTLREGDRVVLEYDGALVCIEAEGFLPHEDVEDALKGAVLEIDKEWLEKEKQKAMDLLTKLEAM